MPKYKYTVINPDNKSLQGTIAAPDEAGARKELNELGFSILSMEEIPEETAAEGQSQVPTFEFAATDKNAKRVVGTIQSEDAYSAFVRLITEYSLAVEYIIDNSLPEAKKEKERAKGSSEFYSKYEDETQKNRKVTTDEKDLKEFEEKQIQLKNQIQFLLDKITGILNEYEKIIKPESKVKIKEHVEKILRIRNSTNLEYIRKEAEDLLTYLQKEEILLQEKERMMEKTKIIVEAQGIMMQLKKTKSQGDVNITESLRKWYNTHIREVENPKPLDKFLGHIVAFLIGANLETPEILELKRKISTLNIQIKEFVSLYFHGPSPEYKKETINSIKRLWQDRKKYKKLLKEEIRRVKALMRAEGKETVGDKILKELYGFTGWLLAFYLIYYFASIYAVSKNFGLTEVPYFFYIYRSAFLKYFLATLFLFHSALSLKLNIFKHSAAATVAIPPVFLIGAFLIYFNF